MSDPLVTCQVNLTHRSVAENGFGLEDEAVAFADVWAIVVG